MADSRCNSLLDNAELMLVVANLNIQSVLEKVEKLSVEPILAMAYGCAAPIVLAFKTCREIQPH